LCDFNIKRGCLENDTTKLKKECFKKLECSRFGGYCKKEHGIGREGGTTCP